MARRGGKRKKGKGNQDGTGLSQLSPAAPQTRHSAPISSPNHPYGEYMARLDRAPSMKDRWRAEDDHRDRQSLRPRNRSRERWIRSPSPRRGYPDTTYRGRELIDTDSYRPLEACDRSRESRRDPPRRRSPSPKRSLKARPHPASHIRQPEGRLDRSPEPSSYRLSKRRRTRSPSPARSDRWAPDRSRSRERAESRERRPVIDRAFSPRRSSPQRPSRPLSRDHPPEIDSYVPSRRNRDPTPPPTRRRDRRSKSPARRTPSPPHRSVRKSPEPELSPFSARRRKTQQLKAEKAALAAKPKAVPRPPSIADESDRESMDGRYTPRGYHGHRGNQSHRGQQRPWVDTRYQHGGPPAGGTPNSSQHGSPHSASSHNNRGGGWGRSVPHGPNNASPPHRQQSYPPPSCPQARNSYHQNPNHGYNGPPQGPSNRGNRGDYRGGKFNQQGPADRRFSAQHPQGPSNRGRGGHHDNQHWNGPKRGGSGPNYANHANKSRSSPAHSHQPSSREPTIDPEQQRQPKELQESPNGLQLNSHEGEQAKDAKFSFAFKAKPPTAPAKASQDLIARNKPAFQNQEGRAPPTQPKAQASRFDQTPSQRFDKPRLQDRRQPYQDRIPYPNDRGQPQGRPAHDRRPERSRSPPHKRQKQEPPKTRPKLPPEFAESESIYYRKPGNESVVGAGTYGKVFKAIHIYTRNKVALKRIRFEGERDGFPITATREIRLLQHLRHEHVVELQEVMVEKNECFMVFEYMSHDLTGLINHPTFKLTAAHRKDLARQMFDGLDFLHRRGVLHRDIKAANILVSNTGKLKYADFGLARFYTKSRQLDYTNRVITIWYRPPELLLGETQYGPAVDIWSAACVFMEMFTRKAAFPGEGGELSQLEKVYNVLGTPTRTEWPSIVELPWFELMQPATRKSRQFESMFAQIFSPKALELIQWCFKYDPVHRPSAEQVLQHEYFVAEEPHGQQPVELADVDGDWHEFESKQHRKDKERKRKEEWEADRAKRKKAEKETREGKAPIGDGEAPPTGAVGASTIEVPPAPMPEAERDEDGAGSDGEGSARMSMS